MYHTAPPTFYIGSVLNGIWVPPYEVFFRHALHRIWARKITTVRFRVQFGRISGFRRFL